MGVKVEELEEARAVLIKELDVATQREDSLMEEIRKQERSIALLQHELKESQRKIDVEQEGKKNLESSLLDLKRKFEDEHNKRTREMTSNQQTSEKISVLEKQVKLILLNNAVWLSKAAKSLTWILTF